MAFPRPVDVLEVEQQGGLVGDERGPYAVRRARGRVPYGDLGAPHRHQPEPREYRDAEVVVVQVPSADLYVAQEREPLPSDGVRDEPRYAEGGAEGRPGEHQCLLERVGVVEVDLGDPLDDVAGPLLPRGRALAAPCCDALGYPRAGGAGGSFLGHGLSLRKKDARLTCCRCAYGRPRSV